MNLRVAINFRSRGLKNPSVHALGQPQHVDGAHHVGLDRLDGIVLVMNRRSRTGEIINLIDFQQDRFDHIVAHQIKPMIFE